MDMVKPPNRALWYAVITTYVCGITVSASTVMYVDHRAAQTDRAVCQLAHQQTRAFERLAERNPDVGSMLADIRRAEREACSD